MLEITAKQEEYLLFLATINNKERFVSEAAEYFDVSKPTVSVICDKLQKSGLITKDENGNFDLSKQGQKYIRKKLELKHKLDECLQSGLGLLPYVAEKESICMVTMLREETINGIIKSLQSTKPKLSEKAKVPMIINDLDIPFRINKKDSEKRSMGDRGFQKPATLTIIDGKAFIILSAAKIEYKPQTTLQRRNTMMGKLDHLWYEYKKKWYEVERRVDNIYIIPFSVINLEDSDNGLIGILKIRARATVGMVNMPESEANIIFDFKDLTIE